MIRDGGVEVQVHARQHTRVEDSFRTPNGRAELAPTNNVAVSRASNIHSSSSLHMTLVSTHILALEVILVYKSQFDIVKPYFTAVKLISYWRWNSLTKDSYLIHCKTFKLDRSIIH